jgi:amino acid permease
VTAEPPVVDRAAVLRGLGGRRSSTALHTLERRAAYLALRAEHATAPAVCEGLIASRETAFLAALASGRGIDRAARIHDLERFAPVLGYLVPDDPGTRADLARQLGAKHRFRERDVPRLRAALGLDDPGLASVFARRFDAPIGGIYRRELTRRERLRWRVAALATALDELPAFWSAFSLTLTQTVGAGTLALPIALAAVGPLPALFLLVVLGAVNVATVAAVAEAFTRTSSVRWDGAYIGRVVREHLGAAAATVLSTALAVLTVGVLLAYYVGFATTLTAATSVPTAVWALVLFVLTAAAVHRGRVGATAAAAIVVGATNIVAILVLSGLAAAHASTERLLATRAPFVGDEPFDATFLGLLFGVVLLAYFGHTSVGNAARVVLRRDPDGRALRLGSVTGMVAAIVLYGVWTVAVLAALDPDRLTDEAGTALEPLAAVAGPAVLVVGSVFAVLAMGTAAVQFSLGLHHQVTEVLTRVRRGLRELLALLPLAGVFALATATLVTGRGSFTGPLSLVGTLTAPLLAGTLPILLVVAARRRGGELPRPAPRWTGRPLPLTVTYLVFLAAIVVHATVIWTAPTARLAAAGVALVALVLTFRALTSTATRPLLVIELRRDHDTGTELLRTVAAGRDVEVPVEVTTAAGVVEARTDGVGLRLPRHARTVTLHPRDDDPHEVKVVLHAVDVAGTSTPLDLAVRLVEPADAGDAGVAVAVPVTAGTGVVASRPNDAALVIDLTADRGRRS